MELQNGNLPAFNSKFTLYMAVCWIIAAFGGLMFGYDIGISGGVTAMDDFLLKFFPEVYERKRHAKEDNYCKYDNQLLQLFTSSLYLAALFASFVASKLCTVIGRKWTIRWASLLFIAGAALTAGGVNLIMLIFGRICFGIGVGFGNEAVPLFLSEVAPFNHRGAVNILFQLFVTIGILIANIVNYFTSKMHPNGWRLSLAIAAVPGLALFLGSFVITETPTSLIERKKYEKGKTVLKKIRGVNDVDAEFDQIVSASEMAQQVKQPFKKLMKLSSMPPLIIAIFLQVFQQFTGINAIMFYAPVLFQTVGLGNDAALLSAVITGLVNVISTLVSILLVDKVGRRVLLLEACVQMFITQVTIRKVGTTRCRWRAQAESNREHALAPVPF
ncbi:sugar transport protein 8-like [Macadamia integrifolia]|uniref:sugar transport protein 8-like n=1 Tax=Macadamia integrifolia TaxID=60698 RepID=UPI001C4F6DAB|nr:sugar transport protein 8-like [Macadamia integrifolia]